MSLKLVYRVNFGGSSRLVGEGEGEESRLATKDQYGNLDFNSLATPPRSEPTEWAERKRSLFSLDKDLTKRVRSAA